MTAVVRRVSFLGLGLAVVSGGAFAQTSGGGSIDTGSVTSAITEAGAAAAVVGAAVLAMSAGIMAYKWIRRAM